MILGEATSQAAKQKQNTKREEQRLVLFSVLNPANMVNAYRVVVTLQIKGQSDYFTRWKGVMENFIDIFFATV